ncbi:MAG: dihydroorotate dehydrogenase [Candidatus Thermoplasmatota archaeon]
MINLETQLSSLRLHNPLMLASGVMDEDHGSIERMIESGAGAIVTKSIGINPREGYPNPTIVEVDHGLINAMGLPNPGVEDFLEEIKKINKDKKIPIIGSIYGSKPNEFLVITEKMSDAGLNAVELNLSCPHAKGLGLEVGSDPKMIYKIVKKIKDNTQIPVFVKLSPNVTSIIELAKAAEKAGADGIVAINTVKAMKIDIELKIPVLYNKIGGYSGKAIKPIGVRCVYEISENVDIPIIGVGGITNGYDVVEYLMAGASAIQIGTGVYYKGPEIFSQIRKELTQWMTEHNYKKITDIIGVAHI